LAKTHGLVASKREDEDALSQKRDAPYRARGTGR
jgi:hypothetical protein